MAYIVEIGKPSFEVFYQQYYPIALNSARRKISFIQDAEDVVCNTFLYCYEHYEEYDPDKAPIGAWLFMVLNSRIKNYYRDKKQMVSFDDGLENLIEEGEYIEQGAQLKNLRSILADALTTLSPIQQRIVILKYFYDFSSIQIGEEVGMTSNHVRTMLSRALDKLEKNEAIQAWGKDVN